MKFDFASRSFIQRDRSTNRHAVVGSDRILTWADLELESDQWIQRASQYGLMRDAPLIILGHKEASCIVAMVSCLRLGVPYVPIDTIYPIERIRRIREISKSAIIFHADQSEFEVFSEDAAPLQEEQLAYIMFTSGSTGEPKGVQIGLESIVELGSWMEGSFDLGVQPVFMNQAPFSFDLSVYEIVGTLHCGGTCVLNSREIISDSSKFYERLRTHVVTTWVSTPSFAYQQLVNREFNRDSLPSLRTFLFCGEVLPVNLAKHLRSRFADSVIINTYGPTEATVATTSVFIDDRMLRHYDSLPVGYSKPHSKVFSDPKSGELCIVGTNVMRGYLNRDDLNIEKMFICAGVRGFRTGDSGFVDKDGLVFCAGRLDDQIKLHGYRIELAEVDAAFRKMPGILNAATIALRKSDRSVVRLVTFVIPSAITHESMKLDVLVLKSNLGNLLPPYMIPSEIVVCDTLPMSTNDKVDKKTLLTMYEGKRG